MAIAFASRIAQFSNGNLRKAILMLEACKVQRLTQPSTHTFCVIKWYGTIVVNLFVHLVCFIWDNTACACDLPVYAHAQTCVALCSYPFTDDQTVEIADWEKFVKNMVGFRNLHTGIYKRETKSIRLEQVELGWRCCLWLRVRSRLAYSRVLWRARSNELCMRGIFT